MSNSADLASCESADIQRRILELIEGASSIAISGHTSPDGDALGSVLGLGLSLMKFFPNKVMPATGSSPETVTQIGQVKASASGSDNLATFTLEDKFLDAASNLLEEGCKLRFVLD